MRTILFDDGTVNQDTLFFNEIKKQNHALLETRNNLTDEYSIDKQKTTYLLQQIEFYKYVNPILFYIYGAIVLFLCFLVFRQKNTKIYIRFIFITIFILYPFLISPLENIFYNNTRFLFALLNGNVYRK
jgi:hypothetical protein